MPGFHAAHQVVVGPDHVPLGQRHRGIGPAQRAGGEERLGLAGDGRGGVPEWFLQGLWG